MASGLVFLNELVGSDNGAVASGALCLVAVGALAVASKGALKKSSDPIFPDEKISLRNISEMISGFIITLGDSVMGKENRKYLPFAGTVFLFVFVCNLLGLIPGFVMPTDQFTYNMGIALVVFIMYHAWGIKEVGLVNYLKHFCGPLWIIAPLLFPIELISHFVRPISLSLRLYCNMTGDHILLGVFTELTKVIFPVVFYLLGTFVCFMQAFVFCLLTMIYIKMGTAHEDHGDHH